MIFCFAQVLDAGQIVELGTPYELLCNDGLFSKLVKQTGKQMSLKLRQLAREAHTSKTGSGGIAASL